MEDKTVMLVELDYPDGENGYVLYSVPDSMEKEAKEAIQMGFQKYEESSVSDQRTICDFIEEEFKTYGIKALCLSYEEVNLKF